MTNSTVTGQNYKIMELKDFDGCLLPTQFFMTKEKIEHFEVRDEDIWVTSYPKSGTTWTQEMVWLLANNLDYEGAKADLEFRFPFIEFNAIEKAIREFHKKQDISTPLTDLVFPDLMKKLNETSGRRFIKTHLPWHLLPRQITDGLKTPKIIHVMRDPKQTAISYYYHASEIIQFFIGNLDMFIDLHIDNKNVYGSYFNTVLSYWKNRHLPNVLIITYEEMHADLKGVIKKVSEFIGKKYEDEEIDKLVHHLSFDQMKNNQAVNKQTQLDNQETPFMRKGTVDSYKSELTEEMIFKLDKWIKENTKGTGLPYELS